MTGALGIFILCFYDFVLIKQFKSIKIAKLKVLKISWIANSLNAVLGFGGIFGATVRYNFYKKYIDCTEVNKLKKNNFFIACIHYLWCRRIVCYGFIKNFS